MKGKILCVALLSAALILMPTPAKQDTSDINNIERKTANVEQARKSATQEVAPLQEKTPEPPAVLSETAVNVQTSDKASEPEPQKQGCEQYRHLFEQYNWPVNIALAICQAESSGNTQAVNWGDNHGKCKGSFSLMQVGCFWYTHYGYTAADRYNPEVNVKIAYQIYERQKSFKAWTTYTGGRYLKFL